MTQYRKCKVFLTLVLQYSCLFDRILDKVFPIASNQPSAAKTCLAGVREYVEDQITTGGNIMTGLVSVLSKAAAFVFIIITGYVLKKKHVFHPDDFYLLSKIVLKVTLPCAIISNFSQISLETSLLFVCVLGIVGNILMSIIGYLIYLRGTREDRGFAVINLSGYNIGNLTLPFVQSFLGPMGVATASLFDAGNTVMCTGVTYTMASAAVGRKEGASMMGVLKSLLSSLPFDAYLTMTVLTLCKISLPEVLLFYTRTVGNANSFLALFMLGIGFELHMEKEKLVKLWKILVVRYGVGILLAVVVYRFLPFALEVRQAMALVSLGPISAVAPAFTGKLEGDVEMSSAINSLSIMLSIILLTIALPILL